MSDATDGLPLIQLDQSPVPGVTVEAIQYILTLAKETRTRLGQFVLDSTLAGTASTNEVEAGLRSQELQERLEEAEHDSEQDDSIGVIPRLTQDADGELQSLSTPDHLHGYHCSDYFDGEWAAHGYFDESAHQWVIQPVSELHPEQRFGFFAIGGPGVDGIRFYYRFGKKGLWAFYPIDKEFVFMADTLDELVELWTAGKLSV